MRKFTRVSSFDFANMSQKKVIRLPFFDIYKYPSKKMQVAVIVSKKQYKKSHDRNRVRRILLQSITESDIFTKGILIVHPQKAIHSISVKELTSSFINNSNLLN